MSVTVHMATLVYIVKQVRSYTLLLQRQKSIVIALCYSLFTVLDIFYSLYVSVIKAIFIISYFYISLMLKVLKVQLWCKRFSLLFFCIPNFGAGENYLQFCKIFRKKYKCL